MIIRKSKKINNQKNYEIFIIKYDRHCVNKYQYFENDTHYQI